MFHLNILLKPDSKCFNSFVLPWVDKSIGTQIFVSVIATFAAQVAAEITHFSDQVKMRLVSQLINGILKNFPKLCKYFNGRDISTSFTLPVTGVYPVILILNLNKWKLLAW